MFKSLMILALTLSTLTAYGKNFSNGYTEFELPAGWDCAIEGSEWVCQSSNKDRQREAIIILAAKKRGPQDTLGEYQAYLKKTKTYQLPGAKTQKSEPKTVKINKINGQDWVDALHLASEVPGFYTRYLATVKADIGVAITFSVTKGLYNVYKGVFDKVIASMRVFRQQNSKLGNVKFGSKNENFEDTTFVNPDENYDIGVKKSRGSSSDDDDGTGLFIIILALAGAAFALKKLKKGGKGKSTAGKKKKKKPTKEA